MSESFDINPVLIIDDDRSIRELLVLHLADRGLTALTASTAEEGEALAARHTISAVVLDVRLPDRSGLQLIESLRRATDAPVLMITAFHDMATTILAMKAGAFDYIQKPIDIEKFDAALNRALEERRVSLSTQTVTAALSGVPELPDIVGESPRMHAIFMEIGKIAASRAAVLIRGESGTGKELIAHVVHEYSTAARPFVAVNCAAIVETLLESELFGHERGAFTGAVGTKLGKCELADDGTLFLDEIGDLSLHLQAKLLRVLQEREFERVGGVKRIPLKARVIAATNRDLPRLVRDGLFREDLYQRLRVVTLEIPPLRERREDIPVLVEHLLHRINERLSRRVLKVPRDVMAELQAMPWPGNVRELENTLIRAVVMAPGEVLLPELVAASREPPAEAAPMVTVEPAVSAPPRTAQVPTLDDVERAHIAHVLALTQGHRGRTCELLGITRPTLERKLRKYGLSVPARSARV